MRRYLLALLFASSVAKADSYPLPNLDGVIVASVTERRDFQFDAGDPFDCFVQVYGYEFVHFCNLHNAKLTTTVTSSSGTGAETIQLDSVRYETRHWRPGVFHEYILYGEVIDPGTTGAPAVGSPVAVVFWNYADEPDTFQGSIVLEEFASASLKAWPSGSR